MGKTVLCARERMVIAEAAHCTVRAGLHADFESSAVNHRRGDMPAMKRVRDDLHRCREKVQQRP